MYNTLSIRINRMIDQVTETKAHESMDDVFNMMFNPEAYERAQEERRQKQALAMKLKAGVLVATVIGEVVVAMKKK